MAATTTLSVRSCRLDAGSTASRPPVQNLSRLQSVFGSATSFNKTHPWRSVVFYTSQPVSAVVRASSRADDYPPYDMSVENALKVLGVSDGASFDEILRAKDSIIASCKDDTETITQVELAYDMLLMQSLSKRRAGRVVNDSIRYADVKTTNVSGTGPVPRWIQDRLKNPPVTIETPSTGDLGLQAGVYGAMMVFTYINGSSSSSGLPYGGSDVPGLILASSFGATLYFLTKRNVKLGKAAAITAGGLVAGAVVGSGVENWLQVDVVPFFGLDSPASVVSEFILFSQFMVSLCLR